MSKNQPVKVTITSMTILKVIAVLLVLMFVYAIRDIIVLLLLSMVLAAALDPWVDWLQKKGLPRGVGIAAIYLSLISIFSLAVILIIPPVLEQAGQLYVNFPNIVEQFTGAVDSFQDFSVKENLQQGLLSVFGQSQTSSTISELFSAIGNFVGGIFGVFAIMVLTFYMVVKEDNIEKLVRMASPERYHEFLTNLLRNISKKLGIWLRSQLLLGLIVGVMVYIPLKIIGVEYALVLALLSGVTELVPFIGPWIGAVPGVLIAFTQAPILGLAAAIVYLLVQQLENNLIVPKVMSKAVGLSPLLVIVALLIGAKIAGVVGALLAVPVALIIQTVIKDFDKIPD